MICALFTKASHAELAPRNVRFDASVAPQMAHKKSRAAHLPFTFGMAKQRPRTNTKGQTMDTAPQGQTAPLSIRVSLGEGRSFVVQESAGMIGGVFGDLSAAMRFARTEAASRGRQLDLRFDESLALIRAAG
jgi:hypothetical protein